MPADGYYVELWRLMLRYPELFARENPWRDSLRETYKAIYAKVKSVKASLGVGWHIWHNSSFSPLYRAEQDLQVLAPYSDFLKIVICNKRAGERMAQYIASVSQTQLGGVPKNELLRIHYDVPGCKDEGSDEQIPNAGLSTDYVLRETRRARAGLANTKTQLWPGIDIDIPTAPDHSKCTPAGTRAAILAAFPGGADGVICLASTRR